MAVENGSNGLLWGLADHQGSIRDVIWSTGFLNEHREFDSFGKFTPGAADFIFGYTGRPFDADADMYDYRGRYYDPATGRFASEDPIGFDAGDPNLYRYVGNSPWNHTDPSGLDYGGFYSNQSASANVATAGGGSQLAAWDWSGLTGSLVNAVATGVGSQLKTMATGFDRGQTLNIQLGVTGVPPCSKALWYRVLR